ncbi:MAG TPA: serine protease, partial [Rhizomicrobium sp.]|nr:serine protease [Rhizomicrobium sp.]
MTKLLMTGALAWALASAPAFGQDSQETSAGTPNPAAENSVKLVAVIVALPVGAPWLSLSYGALCMGGPSVSTWTGGRVPEALPPFATAFKTELERAGYKVITPGEDNLFDPESGAADYEAAAVITAERLDGCRKLVTVFSRAGDVRGDSSMTIDWQVYSRLKKQVVAHVSTTGKSHLENSIPGGEQRLLVDSFASNVGELASNADFRAAMAAPRGLTAGVQAPGQQSKIVLSGSLKAGPRKIADAVGSVVTIMDDLGSGSGVLVSSDGYVLTDAHVVGDSKQARVRWSDGIETLGQVVRVSKNRDVALIKT